MKDIIPALRKLNLLYKEVDDLIKSKNIECKQCGVCCNFNKNGMKLYVSNLEYLYIKHYYGDLRLINGICSAQAENLCTIYSIRPLGCRTQFCTTTLYDLYETYKKKIRDIEIRYNIPYLYRNIFLDRIEKEQFILGGKINEG